MWSWVRDCLSEKKTISFFLFCFERVFFLLQPCNWTLCSTTAGTERQWFQCKWGCQFTCRCPSMATTEWRQSTLRVTFQCCATSGWPHVTNTSPTLAPSTSNSTTSVSRTKPSWTSSFSPFSAPLPPPKTHPHTTQHTLFGRAVALIPLCIHQQHLCTSMSQ